MEDKQILKVLADNPALFDAVKRVLEARFQDDRTDDSAFSDERLGQMYRARITGLREVREAFKEIAKYKSVQGVPSRTNGAR